MFVVFLTEAKTSAAMATTTMHDVNAATDTAVRSRTLELFETKFDRPISVGDVADAVRMSKSHFSRAFSGSVGESPARYLRRYRVGRAHEMMLSTSKSLSEIALNCGFADQSHFTRTFRRMVGVSPAAWRRTFSKGPGFTGQPRI